MNAPTTPASQRLQMRLASHFDNLERVVEETQRFMKDLTDDEDFAYHIVLLTSEAVTNAMEHGNGFDPEKEVELDLQVFANRIEIAVEDEGTGFKPDTVPDPLAQEQLLIDRGRGLFLMEEMADEVHFKDGGKQLRLVCYIPS
ncbi:MAG TPA: ATP-binding protein [Rhodothermales bacterium]|nr:ATP-binding protein [Rhodothermales bacterium]